MCPNFVKNIDSGIPFVFNLNWNFYEEVKIDTYPDYRKKNLDKIIFEMKRNSFINENASKILRSKQKKKHHFFFRKCTKR